MTTTASIKPAQAMLDLMLSGGLSELELEKLFMDFVSLPVTSELLADCAAVLRAKMLPVHLSENADIIDTCGTGGSGKRTINTSTLTALIVATAGGKIAKHGNRSASGNCGCFDLLEQLHVRIDLTPDMEKRIFEELGLVFLFAPAHHPSLKLVAPFRKKYGKKTIFNLFGPLCNPAGIKKQLIGTGNDQHAVLMADALFKLGSFGSKVATGKDGLDEVTSTTETTMYAVTPSGVEKSVFSPMEVSVPYTKESDIEGGAPEENAAVFLKLIQGYGDTAKKNLILLNAAHALMLAGVSPSIQEAFTLAKETLESGKVHNLFQEYRELASSQ